MYREIGKKTVEEGPFLESKLLFYTIELVV